MRTLLLLLLAVSLLVPVGCGDAGSEEQRCLTPVREAYGQGFYIEARQGYERYLQLYPNGEFRREAWERLLEIALNVEGNLDSAIAHLEAMILEFGDQVEGLWELMTRLAELHEQRSNWNKALEVWEKSLELAGDDPVKEVTTELNMARIFRIKREYGVALELLARCQEQAVDEETKIRCQYEVAQTYCFMQSWGQAKEVLEVIVNEGRAPEDIHTLSVFLLADVYEQEMNLDQARKLFESIRDTYPNPKVIDIRLENLGKNKSKS